MADDGTRLVSDESDGHDDDSRDSTRARCGSVHDHLEVQEDDRHSSQQQPTTLMDLLITDDESNVWSNHHRRRGDPQQLFASRVLEEMGLEDRPENVSVFSSPYDGSAFVALHDGPVGTYLDGTRFVFRAVHVPGRSSGAGNAIVDFKCGHVDREKEACMHLRNRVSLNGRLHDDGDDDECLVKMKERFVSDSIFCVAYEHMDRGSIRRRMRKRFPNGLPEKAILFTLRSVLQGLRAIHRAGLVHGEVNAGHVFMSSSLEIKLGFAATVHDEDDDEPIPESSSSYLRAAEICEWAAAPELYGGSRATQGGDMWMVGVAALEMGYGRLEFGSRDEFMEWVERIRRKGKLPKDEIGGGKKCEVLMMLAMMKKEVKRRGRCFSREFVDMVMTCLAAEAGERSTATELLRSDLFGKLDVDMVSVYDLLFD